MKKLYVIAALFMATTAAHAGSGISFQIDGQRIHIEAPRHCDSLSCLQISAPGFNGSLGGLKNSFKSNHDDDYDAVDSTPAPSAPAPVQATAPQPAAPVAAAPAPAPATTIATASPATADAPLSAPVAEPAAASRAAAGPGCRRSGARTDHSDWDLGDRREQGQRSGRSVRQQSLRLRREDQ